MHKQQIEICALSVWKSSDKDFDVFQLNLHSFFVDMKLL